MPKRFNVTGVCIPEQHYMADISGKIDSIITDYIQQGKYFTINRARQYGKTTTLYLLEQRLKVQYVVIPISFEAADEMFASLYTLACGMIRKISRVLKQQDIRDSILKDFNQPISEQFPLDDFSERITALCQESEKEIILIIDEVDKSSDNQIFLSFLGLLRNKYLERMKRNGDTFRSVILAGVYDIKNLKLRLHPQEESRYNSPWNVAADFLVDMSFSPREIASMLEEYEKDYSTGMDIPLISRLIFDYTSGYPYLVSRICQLAEERLTFTEEFPDRRSVWTREGIVFAEQLLRMESNTLFDDMVKKLDDFPKLREMIQSILFCGNNYPFEKENHLINLGLTFGFLKERNRTVAIANRIFETKLYDLFISEMAVESALYQTGTIERNQFVVNGMLQMPDKEAVGNQKIRHADKSRRGSAENWRKKERKNEPGGVRDEF